MITEPDAEALPPAGLERVDVDRLAGVGTSVATVLKLRAGRLAYLYEVSGPRARPLCKGSMNVSTSYGW